MTIVGTCYFPSRQHAYKYFVNCSKSEVQQKVDEGLILIGTPKDYIRGDKKIEHFINKEEGRFFYREVPI